MTQGTGKSPPNSGPGLSGSDVVEQRGAADPPWRAGGAAQTLSEEPVLC